MVYCVSDIHGCYDEFMALLDAINFSDTDELYVIGDVVDRGPKPFEVIQFIMNAPNVTMLMGNHDLMMLESLTTGHGTEHWLNRSGGRETMSEFITLTSSDQDKIIDFIAGLQYYKRLCVNDREFLLVHGGIRVPSDNSPTISNLDSCLESQDKRDLLWLREEFFTHKCMDGVTVIFGHTPIPYLARDIEKYNIWHDPVYKDKILIDGGCIYGGALAALRLDDMKEFYIRKRG